MHRLGEGLLPTPTSRDGKGRNQRDDESCLPGAVVRLPTPRATRGGSSSETAALLPTPRASDAEKGSPNQHGSSGDLMLTSAVHQLLPTPTAQAAKHADTPDHGANAFGHNLWDLPSLLPTPVAERYGSNRSLSPGAATRPSLEGIVTGSLLPTPEAALADGGHLTRGGDRSDELLLSGIAQQAGYAQQWGDYAGAVARHEQALGRPAPPPLAPGPKGGQRLNVVFVEWMQMFPAGWVTDVQVDGPPLTRNEQLRILGNSVVTPQAEAALDDLVAICAATARSAPQ